MRRNRIIAAVLRVIGTLLLLGIIITCIPASVPRLLGYSIYNVVSGSMEPAISVGSAIYVKGCEPAELVTGDVAAFVVEGEVIAHRVVANDTDNAQLMTKGDANDAADLNPVSYGEVIGRVAFVLPLAGNLMVLYTSTSGKLAILGWLIASFLILAVARTLGKRGETVEKPQDAEPVQSESEPQAAAKPKDDSLVRSYRMLKVIGILLVILLAAVLGVIGYILYGYYSEEQHYEEARDAYVTADTAVDASAGQETAESADAAPECPISVDFDALGAVNDEVIGWLYCEDSVINYPICYSGDDDFYLHHAYDGTSSSSGALFLEEVNATDFTDANNIVYGHHMKNGSMFASLSNWAEQEYYEEHPVMWLLTPDANYRVELFAGYTTAASSETYTVFRGNGSNVQAYLDAAIAASDFTSDVEVDGDEGAYIVFSTCEYSFTNARYVLHGKLVVAE